MAFDKKFGPSGRRIDAWFELITQSKKISGSTRGGTKMKSEEKECFHLFRFDRYFHRIVCAMCNLSVHAGNVFKIHPDIDRLEKRVRQLEAERKTERGPGIKVTPEQPIITCDLGAYYED